MAEEVVPQVVVLVTITKEGSLEIRINGTDALQLWGLAKIIEKRADELHFQGMAMANQKKPRILRP